MNTVVTDRQVIAVVRALDEAAEFNRRAKTCPRQHSRGLYRRKDLALQRALSLGPEKFYIDSVSQEDPPILGITHRFSARRFHVRPERMPQEVQDMLAAMSSTVAVGEEGPVPVKLESGGGR